MTAEFELPQAVRQVLGAARCAVRVDEGVLSVAESEMEIRYRLGREGDGWRLDRIDRGEPPLWELSALSVDDVFRYLVVELAPVARAFHGVEPRIFPTFTREPAAGFDREERDGAVTIVQDGRVRARFRPEDPFGVSRSTDFTHYADLPLDRITELVLTTSVSPE